VNENDRWLAGLQRVDPVAYETLVSRFEGPLYRYFLASHGDPQLAGEQSTDCFGELVQALPKMAGGPEQLRPFVFAVARNVLRRRWRRNNTKPAPLEAAGELVYLGPSPDASAEHRDEVNRLFEALDELDLETREVFVLRYVEQLSLAEVAKIVGEPLGTVKSRVYRGRQRLNALLRTTEKP